MVRFLMIYLQNKCRFHYRELFKAEKWNIAIIHQPVADCLSPQGLHSPSWLPPRPSHEYAADPYGMVHGETMRIFFESYDYRKAMGILSTCSLNTDLQLLEPHREALSGPCHLSYPFLIQYDDQWYCTPESAGNNRVDIFRVDPEKAEMAFEKTLIEGVDAVDPTVFFYDGFWWIFYTRKHLSDTHLYISYSKELKGPFLPHANNPVKSDVRSSRPAGTPFIIEGDGLYRPAQDCSETYGGRISIMKIIKITPGEFCEIQVATIGPFKNTSYSKGIHTLAPLGDMTLVDGKRFVFDWFHFKRNLQRKLRKLTGSGMPLEP
jgi:hypothetical protein